MSAENGNPGDQEQPNDSVWLEHARWVWERQRTSFDELGRQAVAFLSLDGVLIGLLANAKPNVHGAARGWIEAAIWPALLSGFLALLAALPRRARKLPATGLHEEWMTYNHGTMQHGMAHHLTETLLGSTDGAKPKSGALAELQTDARWRGAFTFWSGIFAIVAIALVVVAIAVR